MPHKFKCVFGECARHFRSLSKLKRHIADAHETERETAAEDNDNAPPNANAERSEAKRDESKEKEGEPLKTEQPSEQTERFYVSRTPTSAKPTSEAPVDKFITDTVSTHIAEPPSEGEQKRKQSNKRKRSQTASDKCEPIAKKQRTTERKSEGKGEGEGDFSTLHCLCRCADDGKGMIECSKCAEWFHYHCVGLTKRKVQAIAENMEYQCPRCWAKTQPHSAQSASPSSASKQNQKRKLSELGANELAHLCLELGDRVSALQTSLRTAQKQLSVATAFYKKRSWMERQYFP